MSSGLIFFVGFTIFFINFNSFFYVINNNYNITNITNICVYILFVIFFKTIQAIIFDINVSLSKSYKLGQNFEDRGCRLTGMPCGDNMVFQTIKQYGSADKRISWKTKCIQRCSCVNLSLMEKNGKCINQMDVLLGGKVNITFFFFFNLVIIFDKIKLRNAAMVQ